MKTTIDAAGRLVIPKAIRRQAGLQPGMPLDVRWHGGRIEIEPIPVPIAFIRKGHFVVAAHQDEGPTLTSREVEDVRDNIAREQEREL